MKKTLFIIGFLLACLLSYGQQDTSVIMLLNQNIVEEFKSVDQDGNTITSYRRLTKQEAKSYIEKIREENNRLDFDLEMVRMEIRQARDQMRMFTDKESDLLEKLRENKRRIEAYKKFIK